MLFDEFSNIGGRLVNPRSFPLALQGASAGYLGRVRRNRSEGKQAHDWAAIGAYAVRLTQLTGVPIQQVTTGGNFNVFILRKEERRALG